ncbi:hypothetical protein [Azospirillum isscasi]|uniref:Uncharacterized protein n=1 Tax=Azospirillum isscasi TaxID=3053926 RepID=A0ABU0WQN6_9PROT|nr:hypothetical protein [Azospirillum isscasi]MDQ2106557.1 hypothetical protein [Azospirillum isscasi]
MMWRRNDTPADDPVVGALADLDFDLGAFDDPAPAPDAPVVGPLALLGIPDAEPLLGDAIEIRVSVEPGSLGRRVVSVEARYDASGDTRREALLVAVLVLLEDLRGRPL